MTDVARLLHTARQLGITITAGPGGALQMHLADAALRPFATELRQHRNEIAEWFADRCWRCGEKPTKPALLFVTYYGIQTCTFCAIKAVAKYDKTGTWPPNGETHEAV